MIHDGKAIQVPDAFFAVRAKAGSMALMAADAEAKALEPWTNLNAFWQAVSGGSLKVLDKPSDPTPAGKTANAAVATTFTLKASEKRTVPFLWAWCLPGGPRASRMYENWFAGAADAHRQTGPAALPKPVVARKGPAY